MKHIKKVLAWMLVLTMVLCSNTVTTFAETVDETETTVQTEQAVEQTEDVDAEEEAVIDNSSSSTDETVAPDSETVSEDTEEEAIISNDISEDVNEDATDDVTASDDALALDDSDDAGLETYATATKPSDGTTTSQPFSSGTGGSQNFRIPAMATTSGGEIIAATDARYTGTGDGYGLDTMVSYSMDKGSSWNYSYVNYNDDSTGYNGSASAFIDPALAVDGSSVYLFVGLYPGGGVYIGNGKSGTGYTTVNGESVLALYSSTSASSSTTPSYYVSNTKNSDGYYPIYNYSSKTATSYYVDGEYDIYTLDNGSYTAVTGTQIDNSSTTINANIFYTGNANTTGMYVLGTYYLTMRKGTINSDGSISWGSLSILNSQVKNSSESFYGIGPAGAIVTSTGRIVLPMYTYAGADGNASVIYSDDNGSTWTRGASVSDQTSEASVSEVNVNGTKYLYMFTRHGGYYVSSDMGATWSSKKSVSGISYYTGCQLSTLTYSKTIDGYPAILLSVPSNTSGRTNGKIFVGLIQTDGSINWKYNYQVNNSTYQYSDLVELSDGSIGILYENGSASEYYQKLAISTIASGATIGGVTYTAAVSKTSAAVNDTITLSATASDGSDASATTWATSDSSVVSISGTTATAAKEGTATLTATLPDATTQTFKITVSDGSSSDTDDKISEKTVTGETIYQLDTDGVDSGSEYVIYSANGNRILYNVSGSSTTDQVTGTVSDSDYDSDTTITLASGYADSTQLWTVTSSGSGYTIKGNNSGTYLNLASTTSSKANLNSSGSASGSVLTITKSGTGNKVSYYSSNYSSVSVSSSNYNNYKTGYYYLNNNNYIAVTAISYSGSGSSRVWSINNGTYTYTGRNLTLYSKSEGENYLVHSSTTGAQFNTSTSTTGNVLYFFKKVTTTGGTEYTATNTKLLALIAQAEALTEGDYTAASWADLQTALTAAKAIGTPVARDTESAAQTDQDAINTAAKNLNAAINALVKAENITVVIGKTATVENLTGALDTTSLDTNIATATLSDGTLTVTGVKVGLTSVKVGNKVYNITVKTDTVDMDSTPFTSGTTLGASGKVTKLTTSVGLSYDINIDSSVAASGGTWSIADTSIATVDSNGTVTGVKAGETTLTYTVNGETYTMPVVIRSDATSTSSVKTYEFYISEITDTTTYMAICNTTLIDMVEVQEGEAIYLSFAKTDNTAVDFFGAPYEGYALTRMSSTNSAGHYMALSGDPLETDFATKSGAAGANQITSLGSTVVAGMIADAQAKGCDGGMGWTRGSDNTSNVTSTLTFRSEKLPTVAKTVKSVGGKAYTEGMNAKSGDEIVFTITVTKYACEDSITYSDASLTDNLEGAVFSGTSSATKSITISSETGAETQTFDVKYTVQDSDLDTVITNTVDLTYTYKATYSSGSFGSTAKAEAKVNALTFTPKDIVVDFGLPVTIDYSASDAHGRYNLSDDGAKASYGTVSVADNKVTYTPNQTLKGIDTVTITNTKGTEYTFKVYPATTVYYEEGFATFNDSWSGYSKGSSNQTTSEVKTAESLTAANYGYDSAYTSETGASAGTSAKSTEKGDVATFTFTGTGVDVYANTTSSSGNLFIMIKNAAGEVVKFATIKTAMINGDTSATQSQTTDAYNEPVYSCKDLTRGNYTVTINHTASSADGSVADSVGEVKIDGFRVYGTIATDDNVYVNDREDNPVYVEARDLVLAKLGVTAGKSDYTIDDALTLYKNVYDATNSTTITGAVISGDNKYSSESSDDILRNGTKNEIYLYPDETLVFNPNTNREVEVGLKALDGTVNYSISNDTTEVKSGSIGTTTDMFYEAKGIGSDSTVTIKNTSNDNILIVTLIKVCDDPDYTGEFAPLTADDIYNALTVAGLTDKQASTDSSTATTATTANAGDNTQPAVDPSKKDNTTATTATTATTTQPSAEQTTAAKTKAKIKTQPKSVKVKKNKTAKFTVKATGDKLTYQWQVKKNKKWVNVSYSGCKKATMKVKAKKNLNGKKFRCVVKDANGNVVTSKTVTLKVK